MRLFYSLSVLCLAAAPLASARHRSTTSKTKQKGKKSVGIIGAGFSGLFSAIHLANKGYSDITIYEKANRVGGVCNTYTLPDGRAYDTTTMWIPDSSVYGPGIPYFYQEILSSVDADMVTAELQGGIFTPDGDSPSVNLPYQDLFPAISALFQPPFALTRTQVITLIVQGFSLIKSHRLCTDTGLTCTECAICDSPGELPQAFGQRTSTTVLMFILTRIADALGAGPSSGPYLRTADAILRVATLWAVPVMVNALHFLSATRAEVETYAGAEPELLAIMDQNNGAGPVGYYNLKDGFQAFADDIASEFHVLLNTEVTGVRMVNHKKRDIWEIDTSSGRTVHHDILIMANPPRNEKEKSVFPEGPAASAMSLIDTTQEISNVLLYDVRENWNNNIFPPKFAAIRAFLANSPEPPYPFLVKRYADSGAVVIADGIPQGSGLSFEDVARQSEELLQSLTPNDEEMTLLANYTVMFPPSPLPENEGAYREYLIDAVDLRSKGLFVNGEHVCGTGVNQLASCLAGLFAVL